MKQLMPRSAYAEAIRAAYEHRYEGPGIFAISPDTRRNRRKQARIRPGSEAETPFRDIWRAAPTHVKAWALGRLSARYPQLAEDLNDDALTSEAWTPFTRRTMFLGAGESSMPRHCFPDGTPRYSLDREGNLLDNATGELADLTG